MNGGVYFIPHFNIAIGCILASAVIIALKLICFYEVDLLQDHMVICMLDGCLILINIHISFYHSALLIAN